MENIEIIKQAGAKLVEESVEWEFHQLMCVMANENAQWAELLAQDIQVKEMNINALTKYVCDYARKHAKGKSFGGGEKLGRKLIIDFYKLPKTEEPKQKPETPKPTGNVVSLLDLL